MRVYQFHHYGIEIIRFLQHGLLPIPKTTKEVSYEKLTFQTLTPHLYYHIYYHMIVNAELINRGQVMQKVYLKLSF